MARVAVAAGVRGSHKAQFEVPGLQPRAPIEVRRDGGDPMRVKLSWRRPRSGINLFVDRQGRKALELTGRNTMTLQQQGILSTLVDTPIVDRAMEEIMRAPKGGQEA